MYKILDSSLKLVNNRFLPLREKLSPKVSVMQWKLDIFPEKSYEERPVEHNGYINSHLCINAQTQLPHTEHDSSYTLITVPQQNKVKKVKGNNKARFEFIMNESQTIVVSMRPGTVFSYSGYMLTHRQQIIEGAEDSEPLINIVSYNSKRLFNNLMESFRREIHADKTTNPTWKKNKYKTVEFLIKIKILLLTLFYINFMKRTLCPLTKE